MPGKSHRAETLSKARFTRAIQISESHCGPAVIQMLLGNLGIEVSQEAIAEAGGATELIELHGMRIDQLAKAVYALAPGTTFWYKKNSGLEELVKLVDGYNYPVGVEWQGLFDEEDEGPDDGAWPDSDSETGDEDYGHYSIVNFVDLERELFIIVDPYKDFADQDRIFTFKEFEKRWYDFNEVPTKKGGARLVEDFHMMFLVTTQAEIFPQDVGMKAHKG
jgi:hypothetical protein